MAKEYRIEFEGGEDVEEVAKRLVLMVSAILNDRFSAIGWRQGMTHITRHIIDAVREADANATQGLKPPPHG